MLRRDRPYAALSLGLSRRRYKAWSRYIRRSGSSAFSRATAQLSRSVCGCQAVGKRIGSFDQIAAVLL